MTQKEETMLQHEKELQDAVERRKKKKETRDYALQLQEQWEKGVESSCCGG